MRVLDVIKKIDWKDDENKKIGIRLMDDAEAYLMRVEAHIYGSNEIKAYRFMDASEKRSENLTVLSAEMSQQKGI